MKDYDFARHENLSKNLIFIDGLTRAGKSILSRLITTLDKMEHIQFHAIIEWVIPAIKFHGLSDSYASSLLRLSLNELYYNLQISRNVNFRPNDQTGISNFREPEIYHDRLMTSEGGEVFKTLSKGDIYVPFQTHELMTNLDIIERLDLDYKFIEIYRNPFDVIHSWIKRGWGDRFFGTEFHPKGDLSALTLSLNNDGIFVPWFCSEYDIHGFMELTETERVSIMVIDLIRSAISKQKASKHPERIHTITFESMLEQPANQMQNIANFLEMDIHNEKMEIFLKQEDLPKNYNKDLLVEKKKEIRSSISEKTFLEVKKLELEYLSNIYELI